VSCDPDSLEEVIADLLEASKKGAAIIVEGPKDRLSLRNLGAKGPIIMVSQRPTMDLAEEAAREFEEIVVLTDWDPSGEELAQDLERYLLHTNSQVDLEIRKKLKALVRREIKDVESLFKFVERVREETGI
jgi:5S rRNA maturation endonuclease (ribonuclease M5)